MAGLKGVKENTPLLAKNPAVYHANKKLKDFNNKVNNKFDELNKKFATNEGSRIMLTNNEIKGIRSLENRGTLLKGTTRKITSQEEEFPNFFRPLITAGSSLMKSVLTPLAKSALLPLKVTFAASATDAAIQNKIFGSGTTPLIISDEEMDDIIKTVKHLQELVY